MRKQLMIGLTIAALAGYSSTGVFAATNFITLSDAAETVYAPQVSNVQGVKVTAMLQEIRKDAKSWDFAVSLETHTHALSELLERSSVLIADGKQYLPVAWTGSPPGGHHRKGSLHFKPIVPQPESIELQIRLIGDPSPRSFKWVIE